MVEAKVDWIDGERFVAQASSGHAFVIDSDRARNTGPAPWRWYCSVYAVARPLTW